MRRVVVLAALLALAPTAMADPDATSDARAKALFDEGKTLFAEGQFGKACEKLDASFALSRLSSTRGLLAACYEKIGKLASAWVAYRDAAAIAKAQGNAERAQAAADKAKELDDKIARLAIDVTAARTTAKLEVTIDGVVQPAGSFDAPLPIDAGPHVVVVDALGYRAWRTTVDIADGERQTTKVPALVADPAELEAQGGEKKLSRRKLVGLGFGAAGVAAIGVGIAFGVSAKLEWDDAGCTGDGLCPDLDAKAHADSAARSANIATVLGASGLVLVGTGAILYFTGKRGETATVTPSVSPGAVGVVLGGRF